MQFSSKKFLNYLFFNGKNFVPFPTYAAKGYRIFKPSLCTTLAPLAGGSHTATKLHSVPPSRFPYACSRLFYLHVLLSIPLKRNNYLTFKLIKCRIFMCLTKKLKQCRKFLTLHLSISQTN